MSINVVNKHVHTQTDYDIYIGRGSLLGNPYTSKDINKTKAQHQCKTPEESVENFEKYILEKIKQKDKNICDELNRIWKMAKYVDVNLVCFCAPKICHGNIIKKIIEEKL